MGVGVYVGCTLRKGESDTEKKGRDTLNSTERGET